MVAEKAAEVLAPRLHPLTIDLEVDASVGVLEIGRRGPGPQIHPVAHHAVTDEALMTLVCIPKEDAGGDLTADPALRAKHGCPYKSSEHLGAGSHVGGAFQPAAVPNLRSLVHHDRTVPHVEHDTGLHRRTETDHVSRIAEYQASLGHALTRSCHEIGAVGDEERFEGGQQVIGTAEPNSVDFHGWSVFVRAGPALSVRHHPADRFLVMHQAANGRILRECSARGSKPRGSDYRGTLDGGRGFDWRLITFVEAGDV